jgi:hypothetical protein
MIAVIRLVLTVLLIAWVYTGSRLALVIVLSLMAISNEIAVLLYKKGR